MTCNLCRKENTLVKAPAFPEWLHKSLYDQKRWRTALSEKLRWTRAALPEIDCEELLCPECAQHVGAWDAYAQGVLCEGDQGLTVQDLGVHWVISGVRYAPFKLFQMSLIWRASISKRPNVHRVNLGPHAERIREMLVEASPGEKLKYGTMLLLPYPSVQQVLHKTFDPPQRFPTKVYGHTAYLATFGGLGWIFIVSNHSDDLPEDWFLSEDGRLPLAKFESPAVRRFERLADVLEEAQTLQELP